MNSVFIAFKICWRVLKFPACIIVSIVNVISAWVYNCLYCSTFNSREDLWSQPVIGMYQRERYFFNCNFKKFCIHARAHTPTYVVTNIVHLISY
jgi:hypothetical protein